MFWTFALDLIGLASWPSVLLVAGVTLPATSLILPFGLLQASLRNTDHFCPRELLLFCGCLCGWGNVRGRHWVHKARHTFGIEPDVYRARRHPTRRPDHFRSCRDAARRIQHPYTAGVCRALGNPARLGARERASTLSIARQTDAGVTGGCGRQACCRSWHETPRTRARPRPRRRRSASPGHGGEAGRVGRPAVSASPPAQHSGAAIYKTALSDYRVREPDASADGTTLPRRWTSRRSRISRRIEMRRSRCAIRTRRRLRGRRLPSCGWWRSRRSPGATSRRVRRAIGPTQPGGDRDADPGRGQVQEVSGCCS